MKATIKLYQTDHQTKRGYPVKLILSHNRKTRRRTITHSKINEWNIKTELPLPLHDDFDHLYASISEMNRKSNTMEFLQISDFDTAFDYLLNRKQNIVNKSFYDYAEDRVSYMLKLGRTGNATSYKESITQLKKMFPEMPMQQFNTPNLIEFKEWKKSQGNSNAYVKRLLAALRAMYNDGVDKMYYEDTQPFKGVFKGLKVRVRRAKTGYLLRCCLKLLNSLENVTPAQRRSIDLAMLQFFLGGLSFADIYYLKWEYIRNGRVYFPYREKMKDERGAPFDVKLFDCALEIINKHKGEDKIYVFDWTKSVRGEKDFRHNLNRSLKQVQKNHNIFVHPTNINLTTSVFRKSFGTIGKFSGFSEDLLREIMGHEREETDNAYKDLFPQFTRDQAQEKIITL